MKAVEAEPKQIKTVIQIENGAAGVLPHVGSSAVKLGQLRMIFLSSLDTTTGEHLTVGVDARSPDPNKYDTVGVDAKDPSDHLSPETRDHCLRVVWPTAAEVY